MLVYNISVKMSGQMRLLLVLVIACLDVVEAELVNILGGSNNAEVTGMKIQNTQEYAQSTYRIQSRRVFFLRNFLVRYLRYRLDRGMFDVTVILVSPETGGRINMSLNDTRRNREELGAPSRWILTFSPS